MFVLPPQKKPHFIFELVSDYAYVKPCDLIIMLRIMKLMLAPTQESLHN